MSFEALSTEIPLSRDLVDIQSYWSSVMEEARARRATFVNKRPQAQGIINRRKPLPSNYFSVESFLLLLCLTVSLLILPLILPPLPPPPVLLLLLPIGILVVLMILAFMPYDVRDIASSYL